MYHHTREQNGEMVPILAVPDARGVWNMPEGTIVPKDPTSMERVIELSNDLGDTFRCILPARRLSSTLAAVARRMLHLDTCCTTHTRVLQLRNAFYPV